jgi:hypothetical protein
MRDISCIFQLVTVYNRDEWMSARAETWTKVSPVFVVVLPLTCGFSRAGVLSVWLLWLASRAAQHFPVSWTLRLIVLTGLPLSHSTHPSDNSDGTEPSPKYDFTAAYR